MPTLFPVLPLCLAAVNLLSFALMGEDKRRARRHSRQRIPEKVLFLAALPGGALGGWLGMQVFRHKTKHTSFVVGMPLLLAVQLAALAFLLF